MGVGTIAREREGLVSTASSVGTRIVGTSHIYKHQVSSFIVKTASFTINFTIDFYITRKSFLLRHQFIMLNNYDTQFDKYTSKCCRSNGKIALITIIFFFHIIIYLILNIDYGIGWCVHSTWFGEICGISKFEMITWRLFRMHEYMHARVHACTHAGRHARTHARMHTCTHAHMHECTSARVYPCNENMSSPV